MNLVTGAEQALPAGNGVSADNRVRGSEVKACVLWSATVFVDELEVVLCGHLVKVGLFSG